MKQLFRAGGCHSGSASWNVLRKVLRVLRGFQGDFPGPLTSLTGSVCGATQASRTTVCAWRSACRSGTCALESQPSPELSVLRACCYGMQRQARHKKLRNSTWSPQNPGYNSTAGEFTTKVGLESVCQGHQALSLITPSTSNAHRAYLLLPCNPHLMRHRRRDSKIWTGSSPPAKGPIQGPGAGDWRCCG